jgi:hypothetical protein
MGHVGKATAGHRSTAYPAGHVKLLWILWVVYFALTASPYWGPDTVEESKNRDAKVHPRQISLLSGRLSEGCEVFRFFKR